MAASLYASALAGILCGAMSLAGCSLPVLDAPVPDTPVPDTPVPDTTALNTPAPQADATPMSATTSSSAQPSAATISSPASAGSSVQPFVPASPPVAAIVSTDVVTRQPLAALPLPTTAGQLPATGTALTASKPAMTTDKAAATLKPATDHAASAIDLTMPRNGWTMADQQAAAASYWKPGDSVTWKDRPGLKPALGDVGANVDDGDEGFHVGFNSACLAGAIIGAVGGAVHATGSISC
jgi:hypothetical protein